MISNDRFSGMTNQAMLRNLIFFAVDNRLLILQGANYWKQHGSLSGPEFRISLPHVLSSNVLIFDRAQLNALLLDGNFENIRLNSVNHTAKIEKY